MTGSAKKLEMSAAHSSPTGGHGLAHTKIPVPSPTNTNAALDPNGAPVDKVWNENYLKYGRMWGENASETALTLIRALKTAELRNAGDDTFRRKTIADIGCGYGRDTLEFARRGFDVSGVDIAKEGLRLANVSYQDAQVHSPLPGSAQFLHDDMMSAFRNRVGEFDGISTHRTLHLMSREQVIAFADCAADLLSYKGFIAVGARSMNDFNPERMTWAKHKEGITAVYKDRPHHLINFVSKTLLHEAFDSRFNILEITESSEPERKSIEGATQLLIMLAQKKNGTFNPAPGNAAA